MQKSIYLPLTRPSLEGLDKAHQHCWQSWRINPELYHYLLSRQLDLAYVTRSGFKSKKIHFSHEKVEQAIKNSTHVSLLFGKKNSIKGFAFYFILPNQSYCYINKLCVDADLQNEGFGQKLFKKLVKQHHIKWLAARTQNPYVIRLYMRLATKVYPFTTSYNSSKGQQLLKYAMTNVPQISKTSIPIDPFTGVYRGLYGQSLGNIIIKSTSSVTKIEQRLTKFNFNRSVGDSILITAKV